MKQSAVVEASPNRNMEFTPKFFDYSSAAWMVNKRRHGASYRYTCGVESCKNTVLNYRTNCKWHKDAGVVLKSQTEPVVKSQTEPPKPLPEPEPSMRQESVAARVAARRRHIHWEEYRETVNVTPKPSEKWPYKNKVKELLLLKRIRDD